MLSAMRKGFGGHVEDRPIPSIEPSAKAARKARNA
jgi:hypothetical protein